MKMKHMTTIVRLAITAALLAAGIGMATAGETTTAKGGASKLIYLHAPNNATPSVTVWLPSTPTRNGGQIATAKGGAARLIQLHAPNSPTQSVTVRTGK